MKSVATVLSYRLGGTDGVSVEAHKWAWALGELGFDVRRVAGEIAGRAARDDRVIPALAIEPAEGAPPADSGEVLGALAGSELVVVENLCSLPLNPPAARAAAAALGSFPGRVVLHHHDLAWQRERTAGVEGFPPDGAGWLHVTINDLSRRQLAARGIEAVTIPNHFDLDAPPGDRIGTRRAFGFRDDEVVLLHPVRAIPRKDVPTGLRLAAKLADLLGARPVRYWLTGPAEEGHGPALDARLARAPVPVTRGRAASSADAYAACDLVVFPSTWEGFGNPVIESVAARRPIAVARYPVLEELLAWGLEVLFVDEPRAVAERLRDPDPARFDHNLDVARRHCALPDLPGRIDAAFRSVGWR